MTDERDTFESTRARLEDIAAQVRKKDTSLDQSIELLEEGVRLANLCTEQVDQATLATPVSAAVDEDAAVVTGQALVPEVVTAEDVVHEPAVATDAPGAESADEGDSDLSDAWSELDDATDNDTEPAISESQEVLSLETDEDPPDGPASDSDPDQD
jgi:exodeoxyribonuclease VII small subunit